VAYRFPWLFGHHHFDCSWSVGRLRKHRRLSCELFSVHRLRGHMIAVLAEQVDEDWMGFETVRSSIHQVRSFCLTYRMVFSSKHPPKHPFGLVPHALTLAHPVILRLTLKPSSPCFERERSDIVAILLLPLNPLDTLLTSPFDAPSQSG